MRLRLTLVLVVATTIAAGVAAAAGPIPIVAKQAPALDALHVYATSTTGTLVSAVPALPTRVTAPVVDLADPTATLASPGSTDAQVSLTPIEQPPAAPPVPLLPDDGAFQDATATDAGILLPHPATTMGIGSSAPTARRHAVAPDAPALPGDDLAPAASTGSGVTGSGQTGGSSSTQGTSARVVAPPTGFGQHARAAAIAAGGLAALGALIVGGFALYHRIRPATTLDNDTRKQIFDAVCMTPGLGVHAIASQANVSYSTATYHLERLIAAGMIVMTPDGNKLCYYKNGGAFTESERKILPILKNDEATRLLEAILENPGTYRAALAERLGVTATTINWHLKRLREANLVQEDRQGRNAYLYANGLALQQSLPTLAQKLSTSDVAIADRIRRYLGQTGPTQGAASS